MVTVVNGSKTKAEKAKKLKKSKRYSRKVIGRSNGKFATKKERKKIIAYIKTKNWDWKIAQAVAMAESGFRTDVKGDHNNSRAPEGSWGVFQINIAVHKKNIGNRNVKNYKDNIDIAYKIYKQAGNKWRPWGAYTNGKYKQFLVK